MEINSTFLPSKITSDKIPAKFSNELYLSELIDGYLHHTYNSIYSIKYQISGSSNYHLDKHEISLEQNHYLVVNNNQIVTPGHSKSEKAIAIFIEPSTLIDVFYNLKENDELLLSNPFDFRDDQVLFYERTFNVNDDLIGNFLKSLKSSFGLIKNNKNTLTEDSFFHLCKSLILSQQETFKQIKKINCKKYSTKLELFDRMKQAREILIENWNKSIHLNTVSSQVYMSPYHFHRTFSKTFNVSPQAFHSHIRMNKSKELLKTNAYKISDVAQLAGYSDIFSFSKAFKKHFGYSPSNASVLKNQ